MSEAPGLQRAARWHEEQARIFRELIPKLERDGVAPEDIMRARWAAASHAAHANAMLQLVRPGAGGQG